MGFKLTQGMYMCVPHPSSYESPCFGATAFFLLSNISDCRTCLFLSYNTQMNTNEEIQTHFERRKMIKERTKFPFFT